MRVGGDKYLLLRNNGDGEKARFQSSPYAWRSAAAGMLGSGVGHPLPGDNSHLLRCRPGTGGWAL